MREIVELAKTRSVTIIVGTICLLYVITEVKKSIIEVKTEMDKDKR